MSMKSFFMIALLSLHVGGCLPRQKPGREFGISGCR